MKKEEASLAGKCVFYKYNRAYVIYRHDGKTYISSSKEMIDFFSKSKLFKVSDADAFLKSKMVSASTVPGRYILQYKSGNQFEEIIGERISEWKNPKKSSMDEPYLVVPKFKHKKKFVAYFGDSSVRVAYSNDLLKWEKQKMEFGPRAKYFDREAIHIGNVSANKKGIFLFYYTKNDEGYSLGVMVFDRRNPEKLIYRSEREVWKTSPDENDRIKALIGVIYARERVYLYWQSDDSIMVSSFPFIMEETAPRMEKSHKNPILQPSDKHWESEYTFNAAAFEEKGDVHLFYRAIGKNQISVIGHAVSSDGVDIQEKSPSPVYMHKTTKDPSSSVELYSSGYGLGGSEDPRVTRIGDRLYMLYTAFDGYPRVALTSIKVSDLIERNWKWKSPVIISPVGEVHKNWVLFPEKIKGEYAILHSISPEIKIERRKSLNFDKNPIKSSHIFVERKNSWDNKVRGVGAPPIKTDKGWLVFYHAHTKNDPGRYKIGAMLLDRDDPTKVLCRSVKPVIIPDKVYENRGFKPGIVYCCGAAVRDGELYVYYGGADSVLCVAKQNLNVFLDQMVSYQPTGLAQINLDR